MELKDLGFHCYFLRLEVLRLSEGIVLNQRNYVLELISKSKLSSIAYASTPLMQCFKLTTSDYDHEFDTNLEDELI